MILDSASHPLPGCLPASFRGVGFFVPDATTVPGRRIAEHLFPGVDRAAYDDLGARPTEIAVEGIMVGDDYVAQARALEAAFSRPGPGTLIHPWLGGMTVIMEEPAEISFSAGELRVARFSAVFKRIGAAGGGNLVSTAAALFGAVTSLRTAAAVLARAPATVTISQARAAATQRSYRIVRATWSGLPTGKAAPRIAAALPAVPPGDPAACAVRVAAAADALAATVPELTAAPAVSPAAGAVDHEAGLTPLAALDLCLAAAAGLGRNSVDAPSAADKAMLLAAAGDALAVACRLSAHVDHPSRTDAQKLRQRLTSAIGRHLEGLEGLTAGGFAGAGGAQLRAAREVMARVTADINEAIGRLPAIVVLETDRDVDAFQVANHLYGDDALSIESGYTTIVSRNRPRHPARLPAGRVEALK